MTATLIIVYNHRYERNIPVWEKLYEGRFSRILHLMPFYQGNQPNVIPVYDNSFTFQGYFAQAFARFFRPDSAHYLFVADDLLLNPTITECSYADWLGLDPQTSFVPDLEELHKVKGYWPRAGDALAFLHNGRGVEYLRELPSAEDAGKRLAKHGLEIGPLAFRQVYRRPARGSRHSIPYFLHRMKWRVQYGDGVSMPYPLVGSYSDLVAVSGECIRQFCAYCGVYAAMRLHAELAIPTALALATEHIVTEKNLPRKGKALWTAAEVQELRQRHGGKLQHLLTNFPPDTLYYHPVKLSQWDCSASA